MALELICLDNALAAFMPEKYVSRMSREERAGKLKSDMAELDAFRAALS